MKRLKLKPLSVNEAFKGTRFKTKAYKAFISGRIQFAAQTQTAQTTGKGETLCALSMGIFVSPF